MMKTKVAKRVLSCLIATLGVACGSDDVSCIDSEGTVGPCEAEMDSNPYARDSDLGQLEAPLFAQKWAGPALDIGAGGDGDDAGTARDVWAIKSTDNRIYKWDGNTFNLETPSQTAKRIAVSMISGPTLAIPWIVGQNNRVYERSSSVHTSGSWQQRGPNSTCAKDIAVGGYGNDNFNAWMINCNNEILEWQGTSWVKTNDGYGVKITVDGAGVPWVLASDNGVWRRTSATASGNGTWTEVIGYGQDIGGGALVNGTPYVVLSASSNSLWVWKSPGQFEQIDGYGVAVTADNNPLAWVVASSGSVWRND